MAGPSNPTSSPEAFASGDIVFSAGFRDRQSLGLTQWPISVSRAGNNSVIQWDCGGVAQGSDNNTPRLTCDKDTQDPLGLWVEGSGTNYFLNSIHAGAAAGVVGSGGALPTGWTAIGTCTITVGASTSASAISLEFSRASGAVTTCGVYFGGNTQAQYSSNPGDVWTLSAQLQQTATVSGSVVPNLAFARRNSGGTLQAFDACGTAADPLQTDVLFTHECTFANTTAGYYIPALIYTAPTTTFDFTVKIAQEQDEPGTVRSSYIPNAATSTTRPADAITVSSPTAYTALPAWTLAIDARAPQGLVTSATLSEINDGTAANRLTLRLANYRLYATVCVSSSCTDTPLGYWVPLMQGRVVLTFAGGETGLVSFNGSAPVSLTGIPFSTFTAWQLGNGQAGYWQDTIAKISVWRRAYAAADLSLFARYDLYDDFNRPDGAIGAAPTGHRWVRAGNYQNSVVSQTAITGGIATTVGSGQSQTYAYNWFDVGVGQRIKAIGVAYQLPTTSLLDTASTMTLVQTPSGAGYITQITNAGFSSHANFYNNSVALEYWQVGAEYNVGNIWYMSANTKDVVYFANARVAGGALIARRPDGRLARYYNTLFALAASRYGVVEPGFSTSNIPPQILAVKVDAQPTSP